MIHPDSLLTMNALGNHCNSLERFDEAEPFYKSCLDRQISTLGNDHELTLFSIGNLAMVYKKQVKIDESSAENLYSTV